VYRYRVDHPGAGAQLRATHTVEVPLLFGTWQDGGPGERLGGQASGARAVSAELTSAWGRFVRGESPGWAREGINEGPTNSLHITLDTKRKSVYSFPRWAQVSAHEGET
jgi:carboxylesterase type B